MTRISNVGIYRNSFVVFVCYYFPSLQNFIFPPFDRPRTVKLFFSVLFYSPMREAFLCLPNPLLVPCLAGGLLPLLLPRYPVKTRADDEAAFSVF